MLYIGPKIPRGIIQQSLQFAATESHLCGEPALSISILYFSTPWDRYLTKICDQVVALLSAEQSASVVLNDEDSDLESIDVDVGKSDRLFKFEVAKTNEQEEGAVSRPGFQVHIPLFFRPITNLFKMNSRHILHYVAPYESTINPSTFLPRLLHGETAQGFLTATYVRRQIRSDPFHQRPFAKMYLIQLL